MNVAWENNRFIVFTCALNRTRFPFSIIVIVTILNSPRQLYFAKHSHILNRGTATTKMLSYSFSDQRKLGYFTVVNGNAFEQVTFCREWLRCLTVESVTLKLMGLIRTLLFAPKALQALPYYLVNSEYIFLGFTDLLVHKTRAASKKFCDRP